MCSGWAMRRGRVGLRRGMQPDSLPRAAEYRWAKARRRVRATLAKRREPENRTEPGLGFGLKQRRAVEPRRRRPYNADSAQPYGRQLQGLCGLRQEITRRALVPLLHPLPSKKMVDPNYLSEYIRQFWSDINMQYGISRQIGGS